MRLQAVRDLIESDLRHPWTIAELARHAVLAGALSMPISSMYGVSASDYLRQAGLPLPRSIVASGMSVMEAAYAVGYANPANFSTAFRKHFGYVPSSCHRDKLS